jgi:6-phosphogluconolactonase (cycloisomerase 2 family)
VSSSRIWVGGYTDDMTGTATGIQLLGVAADGSLEDRGLAVAADSPSFLASSGDTLYAVGEASGTVSAYRISGGELHFLGLQNAAGELPCALTVIGERAALVVACYGDGTIEVHPLAADGAVRKTVQSLRGEGRSSRINQTGPHAHSALQVDASTVLTTDLGTEDVYIHTFDGELLTRTGTVKLPPLTGPRDLLLHPSGVVWVVGELSHEIFVLERDGEGFAIRGSVALPGAEEGDHAAAVALGSDGKFAYVGLRGSDRIAVVAVGDGGTSLSPVASVWSGGGWPRHLVIDGEYLRVANQLTNSVVTFTIGVDGVPVQHSSLAVQSPTYLLLG